MTEGFYLFTIAISLIAGFGYLTLKYKLEKKSQRIIFAILLVAMILEIIGYFTAKNKINNSLFYNIGWTYIESLLFIGYFYLLEKEQKERNKILIISTILLLWSLTNSIFIQPIQEVFQFYSFLPFGLFIIYLSGRFLKNILNLRYYANWNLLVLPHFWISCLIIFFFIEALTLFGAYQFYPVIVIENVQILFGLNRLLAGIMYLSFGLVFFLPMIYDRYDRVSPY